MEPIEQVFLHVRTVDGCRSAEIAATTEFVRTSDLTEIVAWFSEPEDESILQFDVFHLFFHPLPSGDFAIGIVHPVHRGFFSFLWPPESFYVRILLVPPRTLLRKGNNPVSLFEELRRRRKIPLVSRPPKRLLPIAPSPSTTLLDVPLLKRLASDPGPVAMAALHQSSCDTICTFFHPAPGTSPLPILDGFLNLLPLRYRTELTFSGELHFSRHLPFRMIAVGGSRRLAARQSKMLGIPLLFLEDYKRHVLPPDSLVLDAWPRFVFHTLRTGDFGFFERQLKEEYQTALVGTEEHESWDLRRESLHELAAFWFKAMNEKGAVESGKVGPADVSPEADRCSATVEHLIPLIASESDGLRRHLSHSPTSLESESDQGNCLNSGRGRSDERSPDSERKTIVAERIERFPGLKDRFTLLDSNVARALFGDETVLSDIASLWKEIRNEIPWDERERLREEYVALIRTLIVQPPEDDQTRSIDRNVRLLDLMLLFFDPDKKP